MTASGPDDPSERQEDERHTSGQGECEAKVAAIHVEVELVGWVFRPQVRPGFVEMEDLEDDASDGHKGGENDKNNHEV